MPGVPEDARLKLDRAKQHIQLLNWQVAHFGDRDPYGEVGQLEGPPGRERDYVLRLKVKRHPPRAWSETIGDCLHNLRAALDYLVWALWVETSGQPLRPDQVMFLISDDPSRFANAEQARIGGLPPAARDEIKRLQPFQLADPSAHPLALLRELNNHDKHRFLRTASAAVNRAEIDVTKRANAVVKRHRVAQGLVRDGDELLRATLLSLGKQPRLEITLKTVYTIAFAAGEPAEGKETVPLLEEIRLYIRDTVFPALAPFFE